MWETKSWIRDDWKSEKLHGKVECTNLKGDRTIGEEKKFQFWVHLVWREE